MDGFSKDIAEHMKVVGSDGQHVGTVDRVEGNQIKLTKRDDPDGSGQHHHYIPMSSVQQVDGDKVTLSVPAQQAKAKATGGQQATQNQGTQNQQGAPRSGGQGRPDPNNPPRGNQEPHAKRPGDAAPMSGTGNPDHVGATKNIG